MDVINKNEVNKESKESSLKFLKSKSFNFTEGLFDKRVGYVIFFSSIVSIIAAVIVVKGGIGYQDKKIQEIFDSYQALDCKVKGVLESIAAMESSVNFIKDDFKSTKESFAPIYASIADIRKDLLNIKEEFHIDDSKNMEDFMKKLNSKKYNFIVSLENLISEGTPFDSFLESFESKIDIKQYSTIGELLKFKSMNIKSISELKRDIIAIGLSSFDIAFDEGFWEKQKRVIKEKIIEVIKIKKTDDTAEETNKEIEDKTLYKEAITAISNGDLEKTLSLLGDIKAKTDGINTLISDINKRLDVNKAFLMFKNEFIELESKN
ncbi:MAG: hypothetical protein LBU35_00245 [Holosporales bacterium]|jgi:uncharacterized protein YoxC|nr:hypothetical protein [Holosporales bacterium]